MSVIVRSANKPDLPYVYDIDFEAFSPYGTAESQEAIAARLAVFPEGFVVLEKAGVVLGYGSSEKWLHERDPALDEDPAATHHPRGRILCITAVAVRKAFRNQGFGSAILNQLIAIARQHHCQRILLETTHAQQFYLERGFRLIRERQQSGVTLSIMQLEL